MSEVKYEKYYQEGRHILGEPFAEFVDFFKEYDNKNARVLDVGCGQGRDALFIARLGHAVDGFDLSSTGIAHLLEDAEKEKLNIKAWVADISEHEFDFDSDYDIAIVDRTLHMIADRDLRHKTLNRVASAVGKGGYLLIADEKKNLIAFKQILMEEDWEVTFEKGGFLFMQS